MNASLGAQMAEQLPHRTIEILEYSTDYSRRSGFEGVRDNLAGRSWWQRLQRDLGELRNQAPLKV